MDFSEPLDRLHQRARASVSDSLIVFQDGEFLDRWSFERTNHPIYLMSATKMVVGIALGPILEAHGVGIHQPLAHFFSEWRQGRKQQVTIAMLLNHTSGIQNEPNADAELESAPDWIQLALCAELDTDPGSHFAYNNKAVLLVPGLVERLTGKPLDVVVSEILFDPLGVTETSWFPDQRGTPYTCGGLAMRGLDLARIGQLILDNGLVGDKHIVSPSWIATMTAPGQHLREDFGLLCRRWIDPTSGHLLGIYHDGWLGQYLIICPKTRMVIVRLISRSAALQSDLSRFGDMLDLAEALARA